MRLALFQPEIPQNTGTLLRTGACLGFDIHIIEPCGFAFNHAKLRRSGMDYIDQVRYTRHASWEHFVREVEKENARILLMDADASACPYYTFRFKPTDYLLMGKESSGVPAEVAESCNAKITIPMRTGVRSLNMAVSAAIVMAHTINIEKA